MAPEQARAEKGLSTAVDVYSLGAILYELLTGRPPFPTTPVATKQEIVLQVRTQEPVPPRRLRPAVPLDLEAICLKCLHKEPARRYNSAADLADDLQRWLNGEPVAARPVGRATRAVLWVKRRPWLAGLLAALVLALLTATGSAAWAVRKQMTAAEANAQRKAAEAVLEKKLVLFG